MTANRGCGWFPETSDQMTFRTPKLRLEPMAEKHLGFVQAEASKWEVAQRLSSVPHPTRMTALRTIWPACKLLSRRGNRSAGWSPTERPAPISV